MAEKNKGYSEDFKDQNEKNLTRKQRKVLKKQKLERQRELEKRLVEQGKIPPRVKYERRSFLWNALAVSLAFILGICSVFGGLAIAASQVSVKRLFQMANVDYSEYVAEDYASKSVLEIGLEIAADQFDNLQSIGKYTPYLRTQLENIKEILSQFGARLDVDECMTTAFGELTPYFQNVIQSAELGGVLALSADSDALMLSICYGKENEDYTVDESGKIVMNEDKSATTIGEMTEDGTSVVGRVEVGTMLSVTADSSPSMRYLAYGREGVDYEIVPDETTHTNRIKMLGESKPKKLNELSKDDSTLLDDARICDLVEITEESSFLMRAIKDWTVSQLKHQSRIERLKIKQVLNIDEKTSSRLIRAIADWRIGDLSKQEKIDSLTLDDILTIDEGSPLLLQSLQHSMLGKFEEAIRTLRLEEMVPDLDDNNILKHLKNSTVDTLSADVKALTVQTVFFEDIYGYYENTDAYGKPIDVISEGNEENPSEPKTTVKTTYEDTSGNELTIGYFSEPLNGDLIEGKTVIYDALIAMHNREIDKAEAEGSPAEYVRQTPYYYKERVRVTSDFDFCLVDHGNGGTLVPFDSKPQTETVNGEEKQFYDMTFTKTETDEFGEEYEVSAVVHMYLGVDEADNDFAESLDKRHRIDLERVYTYFDETGKRIPDRPENEADVVEGKVYSDDICHCVEKTETGEATDEYDYYERRVNVYQHYFYRSGNTEIPVADADVTEKYYSVTVTGEGNSATVEEGTAPLTRFIRGMWYFLLNVTDEDGSHHEKDFALLEMDEIVSNVATNVDGAPLLDLWMHGVLSGDAPPDVDISSIKFHVNGVSHAASDPNPCTDCVQNINELTINQTVSLVRHILTLMS